MTKRLHKLVLPEILAAARVKRRQEVAAVLRQAQVWVEVERPAPSRPRGMPEVLRRLVLASAARTTWSPARIAKLEFAKRQQMRVSPISSVPPSSTASMLAAARPASALINASTNIPLVLISLSKLANASG
jgi:hypothetical protein